MTIRSAEISDIEKVAQIELAIEGEQHAATKETLLQRFMMHPEGFLVVEHSDGVVCGYIESCLWDKNDYETFDEICDFPKHHKSHGKTLYIIYLGVAPSYRRYGYGSSLVKALVSYAREQALEKVQLVAGEGFLVDFYSRLGYKVVRELSHFLPYATGTLMEYKV